MSKIQQVVSRDGLRGVIASEPETGAREVWVRFEDGQSVRVPIDLLEHTADGAYRLTADLGDLKAQEFGARPTVLPVIEETLDIERQRVTTGVVRVHKRVHEREEVIDEPTIREEVSIERIPMEQILDAAPGTRREGDTLIIPVVEEVLVIEKRLMLKEEVRITRRRVEDHNPQHVSLRREEVEVEHLPADEGGLAAEA